MFLLAIDRVIAGGDRVPIYMVEEARDVGFTIAIINGPCVRGDVAYDQWISADPSAGIGISERLVMPAIIVRIVD